MSKCAECGFALWHPVLQLSVSTLGLYDDARFPGRSLLMLNDHHTHYEDVPLSLLIDFQQDIQGAVRAIKATTGSSRVNIAVLGNAEPHVHAHLIPRFPDNEELPSKSPWDDPRPKTPLGEHLMHDLITALRDNR